MKDRMQRLSRFLDFTFQKEARWLLVVNILLPFALIVVALILWR